MFIGLNEFATVKFFPGLGINIIFDVFQIFGNTPRVKIALKKTVSTTKPTFMYDVNSSK